MARVTTLIQEQLALDVDQCMSAVDLVGAFRPRGFGKDDVLRGVERLVDRGILWVDRSTSRGNPRYCLAGPISMAARARNEVLQVMDTEEARTTAQVAEMCGLSSSAASNACRDLEEHGWLERGDPAQKRLKFFPPIREPVTGKNYDHVMRIRTELIHVIDNHDLRGPELVHALRRAMDRLLASRELAVVARRLEQFWPELRRSAATASTRSGLKQAVGLRTYERPVPTWRRKPEPSAPPR